MRTVHQAPTLERTAPSSRPGSADRRAAATTAARSFFDDEAGDVPGWVLVTLMTAGLVVVIWALAGPALTTLFERAISSVSGL